MVLRQGSLSKIHNFPPPMNEIASNAWCSFVQIVQNALGVGGRYTFQHLYFATRTQKFTSDILVKNEGKKLYQDVKTVEDRQIDVKECGKDT